MEALHTSIEYSIAQGKFGDGLRPLYNTLERRVLDNTTVALMMHRTRNEWSDTQL